MHARPTRDPLVSAAHHCGGAQCTPRLSRPLLYPMVDPMGHERCQVQQGRAPAYRWVVELAEKPPDLQAHAHIEEEGVGMGHRGRAGDRVSVAAELVLIWVSRGVVNVGEAVLVRRVEVLTLLRDCEDAGDQPRAGPQMKEVNVESWCLQQKMT